MKYIAPTMKEVETNASMFCFCLLIGLGDNY